MYAPDEEFGQLPDVPDDGCQHEAPVLTRPIVFRGRGAVTRPDGRYESQRREAFDDGWTEDEEDPAAPRTELLIDTSKTVISHNDSPDVGFSQSINPYRGCEHGCVYCFARPTHSYLGLSAGLDFETKIAHKPDAVAQLKRELARPGYRCSTIALGINTDGWQPIERKLGLTRGLLAVLAECRHPVTIVTKSALIAERDIDLLADMARDNLVTVAFSITTLDKELARTMEPRAAAPRRRLEAMRMLHEAGVPVSVLVAPLIPALNDHELEAICEAAAGAGAHAAGYVLLRLPHELADIFPAWLQQHYPDRAAHVMSVLRQMHGGQTYRSEFGKRMRGDGVFAQMYSRRMRLIAERLGLNQRRVELDTTLFTPPRPDTPQMSLF